MHVAEQRPKKIATNQWVLSELLPAGIETSARGQMFQENDRR
jgi:hypothetical protein